MFRWLLYILIPTLLLSEPGDQHFYSIFGHAAIRFQSPDMDADYTFTYVGEQLDDGAFARYMAGDLRMGLSVAPTQLYLEREQARRMYEYPLLLPDSVAMALLTICDREARAGYRKQYDPITGSCSHMLALYLAEAVRMVDRQIDYAPFDEEYDLSIRELCTRYTASSPWAQWLYTTLPGSSVDTRHISRMAHLMYPAQLLSLWQGAKIDGVPVLSTERTLLVEGESMHHPCPVTPLVVAVFLLILSLLSYGTYLGQRWMRFLTWPLLALTALMGLVLWYMWLFTDLPYTSWNWLLLPMNPLLVLAWPWRRYWAIPYALLLVALLLYSVFAPYAVMIPAWQITIVALILAMLRDTPVFLKFNKSNIR